MTDSIYKKIKDALDLAIMANVGVTFTPPDAFALLVIMESLEKLRSELTALREQTRWIPVSERLPEKFQRCIVLDKNKLVHNWMHDDALLPLFAEYTHWMPLPEPPEEK